LDCFHRNREAETLAKSDFHVRDTDDFAAHVEKWAAAVAGIDLSGGLQIKLTRQLARFGAENALGHGSLQAQRTANREHPLAYRERIGAAHQHEFEFRRVLVINS